VRAASGLRTSKPHLLYVSDVTFAGIRFGIEQHADARKRAELTEWLEHTVRPMFERRVLPISEDVMLRWRLLVEEGRKVGHTFSQPDLIIAATGLHFGMTVVTRNTGDFERTGVAIIDPWKRAP
jgi:toxin FitB